MENGQVIGIVGAGTMASAIARGLGRPVLATDGGSGRAAALAAELGGEALASNADVFSRADVIVLGHRPDQLDGIASSVDGAGKLIISLLGPTTVAQLRSAYPESTVVRTMPNLPVERGRGVVAVAEGGEAAVEMLAPLGRVVVLPEYQMDLATATSGVLPAYVALLIEAAVDAAVCQGMPLRHALTMVVDTFAGTAELVAARGGDTIGVRREVSSPGESTVRGVAALERNGVRTAFNEAARAVIERLQLPYTGEPVLTAS